MNRASVPWRVGLALASLVLMASRVGAQAPSTDTLLRQLECQPGQDCQPAAPAGSSGRRRGFEPNRRGFSFERNTEEGRQNLEQRVQAGGLPSADLEVTFEFNSDVVGPAAHTTLSTLGQVLQDPKLAGYRFVLVGHTDAKGSVAYNQALSERRAAAVKRYLVEAFHIAPDRLDTYGRGKSQLKNPANPLAGENRRVQVVNAGATTAGR